MSKAENIEVEFKRLAHEARAAEEVLITARDRSARCYLALCEFIREKQINPKDLRAWLKDCGFPKQRASEFARVCFLPDEMYDRYKARELGWRGLLKVARSADEPDPFAGTRRRETGESVQGQTSELTVNRHAVRILKIAGKMKLKAQEWEIGNLYVLRLDRKEVRRDA